MARADDRNGARRLAARLGPYAGFGPATLLFGLFFAAPLALIVAYSFWQVVDYDVVHDWTLENYTYFFRVPTYVRTLVATLWTAALATAITLAAALPLAYWLARYVRPSRRRWLLLAIVIPFWTSYLLRVVAWTTILGEKGVLNKALMSTGAIDEPLSFLLYNRAAVVLVLVYLYFPFAVLTLYATLERFDWTLIRAAADLGAPPAAALRRVLLPQIRPGITAAVIFVFIPVLGEYLTPQLVGGTDGVMIGNLIANFFQGAQYTRGAAAALLVVALVAALLVAFRRHLNALGSAHVR